MSKRVGLMVAMSLLVAVVAVWASHEVQGGLRRLRLTSTATTQDTGTGFYNVLPSGTSDSTINYGVFFRAKANADTVFAQPQGVAGGEPVQMTGKIVTGSSTSAATYYIQNNDTTKISVSLSFTDSNIAATGSWSGGTSGQSGTAVDSRVYLGGNGFETQSRMTIMFNDSGNQSQQTLVLSGSLRTATQNETFLLNATETRIVVHATGGNGLGNSFDTGADTVRLIVFNKTGDVVVDTALNKFDGGNGDSRFFSHNVKFDTGTNTIAVIVWDADSKAYTLATARVTVGLTATPSAESTVTSNFTAVNPTGATGNLVSSVSVQVNPTQTTIGSIQVTSASDATDSGRYTGAFAFVDSGTSGLDTRVGGSIVEVNVRNRAGNLITDLGSEKVLLTIRFNFSNMSASTVASLALLHADEVAGAWETVSGATVDSATGSIVAYVSKFSHFGLGHISGGSTLAASSSSDCVIDNTIGVTSLAGLMPSLRGVRDSFLSTSIGRVFVSGYYAFGGVLVLLIAGSSLAFAGSRREE